MLPIKSISLFFWLSLTRLASSFLPSPITKKVTYCAKANHPTCRRNRLLQENTVSTDTSQSRPHLIFPGGGIYFYWQAGAVTYLREQGYDLAATTMTGASAGALTATLTATDVDFYKATELALSLAADAGVWDRRRGLQGIWGPIIHNWLDELLPEDAIQRVNSNARLSLLVTPIPSFGKEKINNFRDREDLISCNAASVHLPWFLNSKLTATFRDRQYIDGSFLARAKDYKCNARNVKSSQPLILNYSLDPSYQSRRLSSFVNAVNPDGIYKMLEDGKRYARTMEEQGIFSSLTKKSGAQPLEVL